MATALVSLEGVLMTEVGDPIPDGIRLYRVIAEHYRTVITSDMSQAKTEHWLRSNMIFGYAEVYDQRYFFEGQALRHRQIDYAQGQGKVELFVDADADYCAYALSKGIPSLMFAHPKFTRTKRPVKQWDALSDEVERQRLALLDAHLGNSGSRFE
jgi:hypothetical protein